MDPSEAAIRTYRYLRISIVALAVFLAISVAIQIFFGEEGSISDRYLGSISAYYYTPVRSVFVGTLTAMAIGLIAIKGRDAQHEDLLLNIAGMLAPVVAFVPTPIPPREGDPTCVDGLKKCIPDEFIASVENNMITLIALGVVGLAGVAILTWRLGLLTEYRSELLVGVGVLAVFIVWFVAFDETFMRFAHYAAAIAMFALVCVVAVNSARNVNPATDSAELYAAMPAERYKTLYRWVAVAMIVAVVLAIVAGVANAINEIDPVPHWIFLIEAVLLALFASFWVLQTMQFWRTGPAPEPSQG